MNAMLSYFLTEMFKIGGKQNGNTLIPFRFICKLYP